MFNLETELQWWRCSMAGAGHAPEILAELEEHLREDVERRVNAGAALPDAWSAAREQMGEPRALRSEFALAGRVDVLGSLRAHKWKLLSCLGAGMLAAIFLHLVQPATYHSEAKLFIRVVVTPEMTEARRTGRPATIAHAGESDGVMREQLEIISSFELARRVAERVGVDRILGGEADLNHAAAAVRAGLAISNPLHSHVVHVSFRHPNAELVPAVLRAVLEEYIRIQMEIYRDQAVVAGRVSNISVIKAASPAVFDLAAVFRRQGLPILAGIAIGFAWILLSAISRTGRNFAGQKV